MRRFFAFAVLGVACALVNEASAAEKAAPSELIRRTFLGGRVSMLVPRSFRTLSAGEIRLSYPGGNPPESVIIDRTPLFDIAIKHTAVPMKPSGLSEFLDRLRQGIAKPGSEVRIVRLAIAQWDGRSFMLAFLERPNRSRFGARRMDNYTVGTVLDGRLLLIGFNSDVSKRAMWAAVRARMIRSIRVRE
jgi:hypothetical protein